MEIRSAIVVVFTLLRHCKSTYRWSLWTLPTRTLLVVTWCIFYPNCLFVNRVTWHHVDWVYENCWLLWFIGSGWMCWSGLFGDFASKSAKFCQLEKQCELSQCVIVLWLITGVGDGEHGCFVHRTQLQPVTQSPQCQSTDSLQCWGRDYRPFCQNVESKSSVVYRRELRVSSAAHTQC